MPKVLTKISLITLLFLTLFGCNNKKRYLRSDYLSDLKVTFNIDDNYLKNLIGDNDDLKIDLKQDYLIYTLVNYIHPINKLNVKTTNYDQHYKQAIIDKLLKPDGINKDRLISQQEALKYFKIAEEIRENKLFNTSKNIVKYKEKIKSINFNDVKDDRLLIDVTGYNYVSYFQKNEIKIKEVIRKNNEVFLKDVDAKKIVDEIDLTYEDIVDFEKAEIRPLNQSVSLVQNDLRYQKINFLLNENVMKIGQFDVGYRLSKNSIHIDIANNTKNGIFYTDFDIYDIKPKIRLKKSKDNDFTYMKLGLKSSASFGFKKSNYKRIYGSFKNDDVDNLLSKIVHNFKAEDEIIEQEIPLFDLKLPVASIPTLSIKLRIGINIYASGKIELSYKNNLEVGYEKHNDGIRIIKEFNSDANAIVNANTGVTLSLGLMANLLSQSIGDLRLESGIRGEMTNTLYLINKDNMIDQKTLDLPSDYINDVLDNHPNTKLCSQLSLFWLLKLHFNSPGTWLNKLGISKSIDLFKDSKQVLKNKLIMENLRPVDSCGFKERRLKKLTTVKKDSQKIKLDTYYKSLFEQEIYKINILSLPKDVKPQDLLFSSSNDHCASVAPSGMIIAKKKGSCVITIKTKDLKYTQALNIIVKTKNR